PRVWGTMKIPASWLGVPMMMGDRLVGVICVQAYRSHAYGEEEQLLLSTIADQVAVAVENARLYEETKRHAEEMTALHETMLDITAQLEMRRLLDAIIARASDLLGATGGLVFLHDPAREELVAVTCHNLERDYTGLTFEVGEGVAGRVFQTGEPLIIDDYRTWVGKSPQVDDAYARSVMGVPLRWQERVIGVLDIVDNVRAGAFDEQDLQLLMLFADQAAIAIENARLFEETRWRARQLQALTETGLAIGSTLSLDEVLQVALERLGRVVPYDTVSLWLREGELMRIRAVQGFESPEEHIGLTIAIQEDPLSQEILHTRRPIVIADAQQDERFRGLADTGWVRSWLGVPLLSKGEVIGLLTINEREPGLYTEAMAELALAFANQAAIAIENAWLYEAEQERRDLAESLAEATAALTATLDFDQVLDRILEQVSRVIPNDAANIMLVEGDQVRIARWRGYERFGMEEFVSTLLFHIPEVANLQQMVESKEPMVIPDTAAYPGWVRLPETEWLRSYAAAPIIVRGEVIGFLNVDSATPGFFTQAHAAALRAFADHAAAAIENARLYEAEQRRRQDAEALREAALALTAELDRNQVIGRILAQLEQVVPYDSASVQLLQGDKLVIIGGRGFPNLEEIVGISFPLDGD
ncbi:MAG TPA: GAF domain-containing protein, partial [Anaerolineae bacterium]|nr:GAF domain-containing protein [Anaerolineae bacterium]